MRTYARVVATALYLTLSCTSLEAGRAVFTGTNDAEPINAGFRRDSIVLYDTGFQIVNGDNPYRDFADHSMGPTGYSDTWPDFFPELEIRGAGRDRTKVAGEAYRDLAIKPFLTEYSPPYVAARVTLKAALDNVSTRLHLRS